MSAPVTENPLSRCLQLLTGRKEDGNEEEDGDEAGTHGQAERSRVRGREQVEDTCEKALESAKATTALTRFFRRSRG